MQEVGKRESCALGICVTGLWNSEKEWPGAEAAQLIWVLALRRCRGGMCFTWLKVLIWHKWQPLASDVDIRPLETMLALAWAHGANPQPDSFSNHCLLLTCHRGIHFSPSQFTQLHYCSCCGSKVTWLKQSAVWVVHSFVYMIKKSQNVRKPFMVYWVYCWKWLSLM